jgi:hypothetical protein
MIESLCQTCQRCREIVSRKGSTFLLCQLSQQDRRFPKYPPQPIVRCWEYAKKANEEHKA